MKPWLLAIASLGLLACTHTARAYFVSSPVPLDQMTREADLVFKGTVIASEPVADPSLPAHPQLATVQTRFNLVTLIKGEPPGEAIVFRHYEQGEAKCPPSPACPSGEDGPYNVGLANWHPQYSRLEAGKTYLVFAKKDEGAAAWRQLWIEPHLEDQSITPCADDRPATGGTAKAVLWTELLALLRSPTASDVQYAMSRLDALSLKGYFTPFSLPEYERLDVAAAVWPFVSSLNHELARQAVTVLGSHNPYMADAPWPWLQAVGSAKHTREYFGIDPKLRNPGGERYRDDLIALANGTDDAALKAQAILALGLVRDPALPPVIRCWLEDPSPPVRAAAALLLADYPGTAAPASLRMPAEDSVASVRAAAAYAIGFGQMAQAAPILARLLKDPAPLVRLAAAMSLLSFSPATPNFAAIFRANLGNREFEPLFLNGLANEQPGRYLDALADEVARNAEPQTSWPGRSPVANSFHLLYQYLRSQTDAALRSGRFDRCFDAMEKRNSKLESQQLSLYAFYVHHKLKQRAGSFRSAMLAAHGEVLLKQIDEVPTAYEEGYF